MNDFSNITHYSDKAILQQIGKYVKHQRIAQNLTQTELAEKAAISRSTLSLMERGENIVLLNLIKVLRILNALHVWEAFDTPTLISPILLAEAERKQRKRASRSGKDQPPKNQNPPW